MKEITEETISHCLDIKNESNSIEAVLKHLRENGFSKIDSIKVLMTIEAIPLGEAKKIVHFSETWIDRAVNDDAIIENLEIVARKISDDSQAK